MVNLSKNPDCSFAGCVDVLRSSVGPDPHAVGLGRGHDVLGLLGLDFDPCVLGEPHERGEGHLVLLGLAELLVLAVACFGVVLWG